MGTVDGLTIEERGGPERMSCHPENPGSTHHHGCACHEAQWAAKLAAAESEVARLTEELRVAAETLLRHNHDWADRCEVAESEVARLRAALEKIGSSDAPCWFLDDCPDTEEPCGTCGLKRIARRALAQKWETHA